jgi:predicted acylesterase/phospholipase RssA
MSDHTEDAARAAQEAEAASAEEAEKAKEAEKAEAAKTAAENKKKEKAAKIREAIEYLRGEGDETKGKSAEIKAAFFAGKLALAKALKGHEEFGYGWRVLAKARRAEGVDDDAATYLRIIQTGSLCTYKDVNLPLEKRLDDALALLSDEADLANTDSQETLGQAGAIFKLKWEADARREHLEQSLIYYRRGYLAGMQKDQGYTAINAAYVSDLLGYLEEKSDPADARRRRARARRIRQNIIDKVKPLIEPPLVDEGDNKKYLKDLWFYNTVGEAYFGLGPEDKPEGDPEHKGYYREAVEWLVTKPAAAGVEVQSWMVESTARQLARLARIQVAAAASGGEFEQEPAWKAFQKFVEGSVGLEGGAVSSEAVRHSLDGKIGLALSGGGFRASLFHIGVLARLAELDVLRRVEVLSCVSGGSIVGAHYYLKVRELLQTRRDRDIRREHYVEIVEHLADEFVKGVQRNLRMRVAASVKANFKLVFKPGYTRTLRLGELYEEELYSLAYDDAPAARKKKHYLHELKIEPSLGEGREPWKTFKPKSDNWRRDSKAPILIINAATLNTGHNWQFTATYMGESPAAIHTEVDSVYRLRRKYYNEKPDDDERPQLVRLGHAVAASAAVPVLFEPVEINGSYERLDTDANGMRRTTKIKVRLVDGGVCDNQGVASLLEQDCNILLVSDGSGHLEAADVPSSESLGVGLRSDQVLQHRIRGTQYRELDTRNRAALLRGLMFVHLKKDLDNPPVDWEGCPPSFKHDEKGGANSDLTSYGIAKDMQMRLARIRTDLDTFCDLEAYALMASGYLMTSSAYKSSFPEWGTAAVEHPWKFRDVENAMNNPDDKYADEKKYLERVLGAGGSKAFKTWKVWPALNTWTTVTLQVLAVLALGGVAAAICKYSVWHEVNVVPPETARRLAGVLPSVTSLLTFGLVAVSLLCVVLAALLVHFAGRALGVSSWVDTVARRVVGVLLSTVGYSLAKIDFWFFEDRYKACGALPHVVKQTPPAESPPGAGGG